MKKREKGQSAVEFALVLPILLLIVCGILDFGWLFYNQLSVENACREGARVGCVNAQDAHLDQIVTDKVEAILPKNLKSVVVDSKLTNPTSPLEGDLKVNVKAEMNTLTPVLGVIYGKTKELSYTVTIKTES
ncbi:TadE/TadG family type IV pilus assembly protein [uncultured Eubacterium sp.]|uniref:TadE family protein n=1 Tax=uncultured Eubacterium sp. TaxID=165185 RepID=UPI003264C2ED